MALVLFDLDDTLCDYGGARDGRLRTAFGRAFAAAGGIDEAALDALVVESIATQPHGSDHFPALLARHGLADPSLADEARRWYGQNRFLGLRLFPDAIRLLGVARAEGARRVGLITNGPADVQRDKIGLLGLWNHVDFAIISGELGVEKPDPAIFREALRLGGAEAEDAIYIGDSPDYDMAGARAVGIRSVWVNPRGLAWPGDDPPPDAEIRELAELEALLAHG